MTIINPLAARPNKANGSGGHQRPADRIMRATLEMYRVAELAAGQGGPGAQRCRHIMDNAVAVATLEVGDRADALDRAALDLLHRVELIVQDPDFRESVGRAFVEPLYKALCHARVAIYERMAQAGPELVALPWREAA